MWGKVLKRDRDSSDNYWQHHNFLHTSVGIYSCKVYRVKATNAVYKIYFNNKIINSENNSNSQTLMNIKIRLHLEIRACTVSAKNAMRVDHESDKN